MKYSLEGKVGDFSLENRIYNIATFISVLLSTFVLIVNSLNDFPLAFNISTAITIIICSFLYYNSRFRKKPAHNKHLLVSISIYNLIISWIYNDGLNGSTPFIAFYMVIIFLFIYKKAKYELLVATFVVTCLVLFGIELMNPDFVHPYASEDARMLDLIIGLTLILAVSGYIIILFKKSYDNERTVIEEQKKLIEEQNINISNKNEEIITQRDEIITQLEMTEEQRDIISEQNNEITSSITYARNIQEALLPQTSTFNRWFTDSFTYYVPRDIVSGDFYWIKEQEEGLFFAVGDCTGHGVPGAFMSIMSISLLNEIISDKSISSPAKVLFNLRKMIIENLQQNRTKNETKQPATVNDGLDIALCFYNKTSNTLSFSGANNSMYLIRENSQPSYDGGNCKTVKGSGFKLFEIKPDKMPVGIYPNMGEYKTTEIQLYKNDQIILSTDGFADQFGGEKGKKYKSKYFKQALLKLSEYPLEEQKQQLDSIINDWMKHKNEETGQYYEQIDDICIMSVKV